MVDDEPPRGEQPALLLEIWTRLISDAYDRELAQYWITKLHVARAAPPGRRVRRWFWRICETCGERKPLTAFHRQVNLPRGRAYHCKACWNLHMRTRDARRQA